MKLNEITEVTRENFDEVETGLCQYELRYSMERPAWRIGSAAGDIVFCPLFLGAIYLMQKKFPSQFLVPFLGSAAATILGAFLVYLLAAAAARLAHRGKRPAAPTKGSDLERARALLERADAVCGGIPKSPVSWLGVILPIAILVLVTVSEGPKMIKQNGLLGVIVLPMALAILAALLVLPYYVYLSLCRISYKTLNGAPDLHRAIQRYVCDLEIKDERERAARQAAEEAEQKRLRGDELYRRATSGSTVDENLIAEAADLGCRPAGLYMGRKVMEAWTAGQRAKLYTQAELDELAKAGKDYFLTAGPAKDYPEPVQTEVRLGYLVFDAVTEDVDHNTLRLLRDLRRSGTLSKSQERLCDSAIIAAVDTLDYRAEHEALQAELRKSASIPSMAAVIARMEAAESSSSSSWDAMNDDLDIILNNRDDASDDESWRDAE